MQIINNYSSFWK